MKTRSEVSVKAGPWVVVVAAVVVVVLVVPGAVVVVGSASVVATAATGAVVGAVVGWESPEQAPSAKTNSTVSGRYLRPTPLR
jgi:hypothetical protein